MRTSLILTLTRRCNLRCAYCPTVKDGVPDLSVDDVDRAVALFVQRHPEGRREMKLFGGEPLLRPDLVARAITVGTAAGLDVYLSTNGTRFTAEILDLLRANPGVTLTVSIDGTARDHDGLRRSPGEPPSWAVIQHWLPELLRMPRFVVTQTIAPSTAARAADNFLALRAMGIRRFNLLPGYYLPWSDTQLAALEASFTQIGEHYTAAWDAGDRLYLRNLTTLAPTPFYNTGMVVDADRRIHPSNLVLAEAVGDRTAVGTLDDPPSVEALAAAAATIPALLADVYPADVLASTAAVDAALTRLCNRLYPAFFAHRRARGAA
jgi:hypothetical protein